MSYKSQWTAKELDALRVAYAATDETLRPMVRIHQIADQFASHSPRAIRAVLSAYYIDPGSVVINALTKQRERYRIRERENDERRRLGIAAVRKRALRNGNLDTQGLMEMIVCAKRKYA